MIKKTDTRKPYINTMKEKIETSNVPKAIGTYSQAIKSSWKLYKKETNKCYIVFSPISTAWRATAVGSAMGASFISKFFGSS